MRSHWTAPAPAIYRDIVPAIPAGAPCTLPIVADLGSGTVRRGQVHNIGADAREEDILFRHTIIWSLADASGGGG